MLASLSAAVRETLCERPLRVRVAALAIGGLLQGLPLPDAIQPPLREILARMLRVYVDVFVQLDLEVGWSSDGQVLGIFEKPKPAFNCHPQSGEPTFFSGIHSQSSILQARREGERFRGVAATDVFWGDGEICGSDAEIEVSLLEHVDEVIRRCTRRVLMEPGDVVLLDSYSVLHGRDTFTGKRQHGVIWLTCPSFGRDD